jgi:hypothetical protein
MVEKCRFNIKENSRTNSIYCEKLDQWVSVKLCDMCLSYEKAIDNNKNRLLHSYNYSYNIANDNNAGERGKTSLLLKKFIITFSEDS